jgi:ferredoxin-NADP reductase
MSISSIGIEAVVTDQELLSTNLYLVTMLVTKGSSFLAGQYYSITTLNHPILGPYSIASVPEDLPFLKFCLRKKIPIEPYESVILSQAVGKLVAEEPANYIFCARGIGITPFLSLLKAYETEKELVCYWYCKDERDLILKKIFNIKDSLKILNQEEDFKKKLQTHLTDDNAFFYLAGPFSFVADLGEWLLIHNIDSRRIRSDMKDFSRN